LTVFRGTGCKAFPFPRPGLFVRLEGGSRDDQHSPNLKNGAGLASPCLSGTFRQALHERAVWTAQNGLLLCYPGPANVLRPPPTEACRRLLIHRTPCGLGSVNRVFLMRSALNGRMFFCVLALVKRSLFQRISLVGGKFLTRDLLCLELGRGL
jgi:hypothetical protein